MDEHDPVDDGKFVYRRIHRTFLYPTAQIPVQFPASRPTTNDATGLSFYRARYLVQPQDVLANVPPDKARNYYIARLAVRDLRNLGLNVVPEPVSGGPLGYAVIPELTWPAYQANRQHWKPILVELARLASADLVHPAEFSPMRKDSRAVFWRREPALVPAHTLPVRVEQSTPRVDGPW